MPDANSRTTAGIRNIRAPFPHTRAYKTASKFPFPNLTLRDAYPAVPAQKFRRDGRPKSGNESQTVVGRRPRIDRRSSGSAAISNLRSAAPYRRSPNKYSQKIESLSKSIRKTLKVN